MLIFRGREFKVVLAFDDGVVEEGVAEGADDVVAAQAVNKQTKQI